MIKVNLDPEYFLKDYNKYEYFSTYTLEELDLRVVHNYCKKEQLCGAINTYNLIYENKILHFVEVKKNIYKLAHYKKLSL